MSERIERTGDSVIVYDDALVDQADESMFAPPAPDGVATSAHGLAGRGGTYLVTVAGRACVLRHYFRGGLIRKFAEDSFVWAGEDRTRSFGEWRLLAELYRRGLPVPRPIAARYIRRGRLYTADLITERLPDVRSLAARLGMGGLHDETWRSIGAMIARFHREHVFHADLNAHNIQLDDAGRLYLLDFDRGAILPDDGAWSHRNLKRLRRSLDKISTQGGAHFSHRDWESLLQGYGGGR